MITILKKKIRIITFLCILTTGKVFCDVSPSRFDYDNRYAHYYAIPVEYHDIMCSQENSMCLSDHKIYSQLNISLYRIWFFFDLMYSSQNSFSAQVHLQDFLSSLLIDLINMMKFINNDVDHIDERMHIISIINNILENPLIQNFSDIFCLLMLIKNNVENVSNNENLMKNYLFIAII